MCATVCAKELAAAGQSKLRAHLVAFIGVGAEQDGDIRQNLALLNRRRRRHRQFHAVHNRSPLAAIPGVLIGQTVRVGLVAPLPDLLHRLVPHARDDLPPLRLVVRLVVRRLAVRALHPRAHRDVRCVLHADACALVGRACHEKQLAVKKEQNAGLSEGGVAGSDLCSCSSSRTSGRA